MANAGERKRLVGILPALLKNLQAGMDIAAVETGDRARFFSALVDCHAAAVKAGLRGETVANLLATANPNVELAPLFAKLVDAERAADTNRNTVSRSGAARIQFTDRGVEIHELVAAKSASDDDSNLRREKVSGEKHESAHVDFDSSAAQHWSN